MSLRERRCGVVKFLAYGWSAQRSRPRDRDQVDGRAGGGAPHGAGTGSLAEQRAYLDEFWERADVEIEGDAELQQAVRFALFHTLQAARAASDARSPPRG